MPGTAPITEDSIPRDAQLAIVEQTLAQWKQARYQAKVNHRVHKAIGSDEPTIASWAAEAVRAEKAIDELEALIETIVPADQ